MNRAISRIATNEPMTIPAIVPSERPLSVEVGNEVEDKMLVLITVFIELDNINDDSGSSIK